MISHSEVGREEMTESREIFRLRSLATALRVHGVHKLRVHRNRNPMELLKAASAVTGKRYSASEYEKAARDIDARRKQLEQQERIDRAIKETMK